MSWERGREGGREERGEREERERRERGERERRERGEREERALCVPSGKSPSPTKGGAAANKGLSARSGFCPKKISKSHPRGGRRERDSFKGQDREFLGAQKREKFPQVPLLPWNLVTVSADQPHRNGGNFTPKNFPSE